MKKPLYKRAWFILVMGLAAVVLALIFWFGLKIAGVLIDSANWQKNIQFEEYKDDLNVLAEYVTENFQPSENYLDLKIDNETEKGYLSEMGTEYQLPTEVGEAIVRLRLANNPDLFPDDLGGVDYLNYHDDDILLFSVEAHPYSLCYSPQRSPKGFLQDKFSNRKVSVKKLEDCWYAVRNSYI